MKSNQFFVSVIIPVYNGETFLSQAVESIQRQDYEPLEIIIVDDGSTDETAQLVASLDKKIRYVYQSNRGPAAARNKGLKMARGEIISFLDVDDLWPEDKLKLQLAHLLNKPNVDIVMGHIQCMWLSEIVDHKPKFKLYAAPFFTFLVGATLFRRSVFNQVGLFDDKLYSGEDVDWFMRARESNISMLILEQVTLIYRIHQHNMSRTRDIRNQNFIKALKKSLDRRRRQSNEAAISLPKPSILKESIAITENHIVDE